jgi:hypothetical protein
MFQKLVVNKKNIVFQILLINITIVIYYIVMPVMSYDVLLLEWSSAL